MRVRTRYGRLHYRPEGLEGLAGEIGEPSAPLTLLVDYLLLLGSTKLADVDRAIAALKVVDALLAETGGERRFHRQVSKWRRTGIPKLFLRAARRASEGRFTPGMGAHLSRVRYGGDHDEASDLLALAAWCLDQAMRTSKFHVRSCKLCGQPFLAGERARYCLRAAPSGPLAKEEMESQRAPGNIGAVLGLFGYSTTCQQVGSVKDYRARERAKKEGDDDDGH